MCDALNRAEWDDGGLPVSLISGLTGLSIGRLGRWHRAGIAAAAKRPGGDGWRREYTWREYSHIRAAQKLLERGIAHRDLQERLARMDASIEGWHQVTRAEFRLWCVYERGDGSFTLANLGSDAPGSDGRFHFSRFDAIDCPDCRASVEIVEELRREGPLAGMRRFDDRIAMSPRIRGGYPCIRDTRLATYMMLEYHEPGMSAQEIGETLGVNPQAVDAAIQCERALRAARS